MNKSRCSNCGDAIAFNYTQDWTCCRCYYKSGGDVGLFVNIEGKHCRYGGKHAFGFVYSDEKEGEK